MVVAMDVGELSEACRYKPLPTFGLTAPCSCSCSSLSCPRVTASTSLFRTSKRAAFQCLRQAVKYAFDSWRMWYNYMVVAMDVGVALVSARDGVDELVQDLDVDRRHAVLFDPHPDHGILPHVSSSPDVFLAHARLSLWSGDYAAALDSHLTKDRAWNFQSLATGCPFLPSLVPRFSSMVTTVSSAALALVRRLCRRARLALESVPRRRRQR
jgi:hypothetical protein